MTTKIDTFELPPRLSASRMRKAQKIIPGFLRSQRESIPWTEKNFMGMPTVMGIDHVHQQIFLFNNRSVFHAVDFWLPEHRIAIELDGRSHEGWRDLRRSENFRETYPDVKFIRYRNEEVWPDDSDFQERVAHDISTLAGNELDAAFAATVG